jgi:hypothetical protein
MAAFVQLKLGDYEQVFVVEMSRGFKEEEYVLKSKWAFYYGLKQSP